MPRWDGWVQGRSTLITGKPKTGKTSIAYSAIAQNQAAVQGTFCAMFAQEDKHDEHYFSSMGGNNERIIVNPIDYAEVTLDSILDIARDPEKFSNIDFIFLDSLRNLPAQQRIEESLAKADFGVEAKVINKFYTELSVLQYKRRVVGKPLTVFCTNHETEGHAPSPNAPPPVVIPRGKQQLYGSHLRIRLRNPKYVGEQTINGIKVPFQLECKFIVEANLGGPGKIEGEYRLYQVPFQSQLPGQIDDYDFFYKQGVLTSYIRGRKPLIVGGKEFNNKGELMEFWKREKEEYIKDKNIILPLAIEFFKQVTTAGGGGKIEKGEEINE